MIVGTVVGGHSGGQQGTVQHIDVVDLDSSPVTTVRPARPGNELIVQPAQLADGVVYWRNGSRVVTHLRGIVPAASPESGQFRAQWSAATDH